MFSIRITLCLVCLVILCNLSVYESRKVSGGGRRTTWSRPSSTSIAKPKPQPTFSHSDITKLSYGHNEPSAARRPASPPRNTNTNSHKPSAPPAEHPHNTYQQNAPPPRPNTNANPNPNNPNPNNIGWNVPQNNPGGSNNIGWNTNNQQHTQQRVNTANAPPPYPGAPQPQGPPPPYPGNPSHGQNIGAPPAYPGNPSYGQNIGAPPAYPGYSNHGQNMGAPPAYPGYPNHGQNVGPPPPYPGLNTQTGYHGTNYNPNQARYPQQPGYGGVGGYQGYPQQYPGGFGGAPGGYGGYGGLGGLGGFGGGGYGGGGFGGGGYGGYGNGMFAPKKSGISGTTLVGGALLGLTLYSLARDRNQYHYYYPNSQPVHQNGQPGNVQGQGQGNMQGTANMPNGEHSFKGDQGAYTSYIGNLSCISIYNAREVSLWANNTLQEFYRQYPTQAFPVSVNGSNQSMNFTIVPGEIIHNETLAVTCCGTDKGPIDVLMITNGKSRDVNCIYETYTMPFRRLNFIPINNTAITNATNSTPPVAAPLTSTAVAGNTTTTMAGITSTTMAGITSTAMAGITSTAMTGITSTTVVGNTTVIAATNATTVAAATTQEVIAESTTTPTTTTTTAAATAVQSSSVNVTEVPTTIPSVELTTIKN